MRSEVRRLRAPLGEGREQRGHGPVHFAHSEPPVARVALDAFDARERAQRAFGDSRRGRVRDREFDHVLGAERRDQLARRAERDHFAVVNDRHTIAELSRLLHVVGRQENRAPSCLETFDDPPGLAPRLRVETCRRLIEEQELRISDQRTRKR
jgi:hypothetical protein